MVEADIYKALGDPIRLEMIRRLTTSRVCTVGELSGDLGISRQGARKQLQVLVDAQVVRLTQHGRSTDVTLEIETLQKARAFITRIEQQWDERLNALKRFVEEGGSD